MRRLIFSAIVLMGFLLGSVLGAFPQATTGNIQGRVTDSSGAVVVGAEVSAKNAATGLTQKASSNDSGYALYNLPPGTYSVTAAKTGFKKAAQSGILLLIDQKLRLDFELVPGAVSDSVTVTSEAPLLQTQSVETGEVIQTRQIVDLPLDGRNFLELSRLVPGVVSGSGGNKSNLAVNGQREFGNSIMIDGIETTGNRNNDISLTPSVDAVEEFKIVTSAYSAEFGRAAGGVVSIQTKSGTNGYHGSAYEFFRPNNTAAQPYSFGAPSQPSSLKHHNFGGTLGGPIVKDKLFFFGSYEAFRLRNVFSFLDSVPPTNQIDFLSNGDVDLSRLKDPLTGNTIPIYDPVFFQTNFYTQQFPGNIIPVASVSPAGKAILQNFFPAPTLPGSLNGWYGNFQSRETFKDDLNNIDARVDYNLSEHDRISAVYHYGDEDELLGDRFAGFIPVEGGGSDDSGNTINSRDQSFSVTETHIFSPRLINELRFGYSRFRLDERDLLDGRSLASQFGIGNVNIPEFPSTLGFPQIFLGTGYDTGGSTFEPLFFRDNNYQITDSVSAKLGKHDFKAGIDYRRLRSNPNFALFPTGYQYYGGAYSSLTQDPYGVLCDYSGATFFGCGGSDIADLLLGLPLQVNIGLQLTNPTTKSWEIHFYGQDSWQVTPHLVLTYGLRYEFQSPYTEKDNNVSNFDLNTNTILVAGRGGNSESLLNPDKNNLSPRIGFSYQFSPHTVLRGGYGLYYTPENDARNDVLTKDYPFNVQQFVFNNIFDNFSGLPFPDYSLDNGIPRTTSIPPIPSNGRFDPATIPNSSSQQLFFVDPNFRTGYSQLFNMTVQQEMTPSLSLDLAYVGSLSRKLPYAVGDINKVDPLTKVRRITPLLGQIGGQFAVGSGSYHSLQAKLTKRFSQHLSLLTSYTFGKNMDNGPAPFNLGRGVNSHNQPQDPFNLAAEKAVGDDDVKHNLVFSALYELPFGRGRRYFATWSGIPQTILGGWQVNTIFEARTGLPVNVIQSGKNTTDPGLRPNLLRDPNLPRSDRTLEQYFDTGAFCTPTKGPCPDLAPSGAGDAGRNVIRGPGFINVDFSVFKDFQIRESMKLQFRFEFFDLLNTPHFANPASDFSEIGFGQISGTIGDPRNVQFALKFLF